MKESFILTIADRAKHSQKTTKDKSTLIMKTIGITQIVQTSQPWRREKAVAALLCCLVTCSVLTTDAQVFTGWQAVDENTQVAYGVLSNVNVTLWGGNMKTAGSVVNGSYTGFASSSYFSPPLVQSDAIYFEPTTSLQRYRVDFSKPVQNPVIHLASLASILTFGSTNIARLSGKRTSSLCLVLWWGTTCQETLVMKPDPSAWMVCILLSPSPPYRRGLPTAHSCRSGNSRKHLNQGPHKRPSGRTELPNRAEQGLPNSISKKRRKRRLVFPGRRHGR